MTHARIAFALLLTTTGCKKEVAPDPIPTATPLPELPTQAPGACDASAVHVLEDGTLLVAIDETTSVHRWSRMLEPGAPTDLAGPMEARAGEILNRDDEGRIREFDLEGVAATEDGLLWVGSHGYGKRKKDKPKAKKRPNRRVLVETDETGVYRRYTNLTSALKAAPDVGPTLTQLLDDRVAPKEGGVNIEGLASDGAGGLWVGLRSPLTADGKAWLLHLASVEDAFGGAPSFDRAVAVDLGGRGVRALEPDGKGFLVVAGNSGDDSDGKVGQVRSWTAGSTVSTLVTDLPTGFRAEGMAVSTDELLLVSDDGAVERSGIACKDRYEADAGDAEVYFRVLRLPRG